MSVKSSKNTMAGSYFQMALSQWVNASGKKKTELAAKLNIAPSTLSDYLRGNKVPSLAQMEEFAIEINQNLLDMLIEGRAILEGEEQSRAQRKVDLEEFSPEQQVAIEAFKTCLRIGGEGAEMLADQAIRQATKKLKEQEYQNPTPRRLSKSA